MVIASYSGIGVFGFISGLVRGNGVCRKDAADKLSMERADGVKKTG